MKLYSSRRNGRLPTIALLSIFLFVASCDGNTTSPAPPPNPGTTLTPPVQRVIGIQAGHGNGDSGASLCSGANKIPGIDNEADLNLAIANKVVELLRSVNGYTVHLYVGKDSRMKGLKADAFVAVHADQGKPGISGYKVSRFGGQKGSGLDGSGDASDRLVQAIWDEYGSATGLIKDTSPGHFTDDMLYYYALGWIDTSTPGAIIEMGWLCDDLPILLYEQERVAHGIARGIVKFLGDSTAQLPPIPTRLPPTQSPVPSVTQEISGVLFTINANRGWQDTGISIVRGSQVSIEYVSGLWFEDPPGQWHDASGEPNPWICTAPTCHEPSHDFPKYALIGKIGEGGALLKIGNGLDFVAEAETTGILYLRPNYGDVDIPIHNPQGAVTVTITIR